jgi:DNA-binding response OmpR family regulator
MNDRNLPLGLTVALASDKTLQSELKELIIAQGYQVKTVSPTGQGLEESKAQVLVYASRLPLEKAGQEISFLRTALREHPIPILCVHTEIGRSQSASLLEAGADDVIHKPFDSRIFHARLNALLRRSLWSGVLAEKMAPLLEFGSIQMNLISRLASADERPLILSRLEFDLLAYLLKRPGAVQSRKDILSAVWGYPEEVRTRTLDKYVESLRRKLGPTGECIQTIHGVGYCLTPSDGAGSRTSKKTA